MRHATAEEAARTAAVIRRIAQLKRELGADKHYGKGHTVTWERGAADAEAAARRIAEEVRG